MEFTKKDIIIYKKLKQKLSRDKIKKLIKNQDEFDLPDEIRSVLSKFRVQNGGAGAILGYDNVAGIKRIGYNVARGITMGMVPQMDQQDKLKEKLDIQIYSKVKNLPGCEETQNMRGMEVLLKDTCRINLIKKSMPSYDIYIGIFGELTNIFNQKDMNQKILLYNKFKKKWTDMYKEKPVIEELLGKISFYQWLLKNSKKFRDLDNISRNFTTYPNYESLQESPAFQQGYQDQMNKYLQESPEYNQGYQDGIEYLQENPNFEEQPLHEIEYYNQQVPLEENPNYVEYPQQQYPNTMETPYGDRYIINYN